MTNYKSKKEKFKDLKKACKEYYINIAGSNSYNNEKMSVIFPYGVVKCYFKKDDSEVSDILDNLKNNDFGIDGFFVDEEIKKVIFLQFKTSESDNGEGKIEDKDLSFLDDVEKRLNNLSDNHTNRRVIEIRNEYISCCKEEGYLVEKYFFCSFKDEKLKERQEKYRDLKIIDLDGIYDSLDEYEKEDRENPEFFSIEFIDPENKKDGENKGDIFYYAPKYRNKTSVGIIDGMEVIRLMDEYGHSLFDKNVRYFLGANKINKKMGETINDNPEDFYYYNNGITITCVKMEKEGRGLKLTRPQIINGAQTLSTIYETYKTNESSKAKNKGDNHYQQIKLLAMVIHVAKDEDHKFAQNITKYRNANNPIKLSDYKGNCKIQEAIQKKMYELDYFYCIKRGEDKIYLRSKASETHNVIGDYEYKEELKNNYKQLNLKLENILSIMTAYYGDPTLAKANTSNIFSNDNNYKKIMGENARSITNDKVKNIIIIARINAIIKYLGKIDIDTNDGNDKKKLSEVFDSKYDNYVKNKENKESLNKLVEYSSYLNNGRQAILAGLYFLWKDRDLIEEDILKKEFLNQYNNDEFWWKRIPKMVYYILKQVEHVYKNNKKLTFTNYAKKDEFWKDLKKVVENMDRDDKTNFLL